MSATRRVLLLIPGMTDERLEALGGRTPLQTARIPALDECARRGVFGRTLVVPPERSRRGVIGVPALLGYGDCVPLGRAALEARGLGIAPPPGSLVLRMDFISTFRGTLADPRAGQLSDGEADLLLETLRQIATPFDLRLHRGFSYRHLAVVQQASGWEVGTVPPHEFVGQPLADFLPIGRDAAGIVRFQEDATAVLADHVVNRVRVDLGENPADGVWFWGEGGEVHLSSLRELWGLRAAMVTAVPLLRGFALSTGMSCPPCRERSAESEEGLRRRCALALSLAEDHDLVALHVGGVLDRSRSRDAVGKVRVLEQIDRAVVAPLLRWAQTSLGHRLMVTCDYPSSITGESRRAAPQPFALLDEGATRPAPGFDEIHADEVPTQDRLRPLVDRFLG